MPCRAVPDSRDGCTRRQQTVGRYWSREPATRHGGSGTGLSPNQDELLVAPAFGAAFTRRILSHRSVTTQSSPHHNSRTSLQLARVAMLARRVVFRSAASLLHRPTRACAVLPICNAVPSVTSTIARPNDIALSLRFYATPGRPKKGSVGESSPRAKTVKPKAVKAAKPKASSDGAAKKTPTKRTTGAKKTSSRPTGVIAKAAAKQAATTESKKSRDAEKKRAAKARREEAAKAKSAALKVKQAAQKAKLQEQKQKKAAEEKQKRKVAAEKRKLKAEKRKADAPRLLLNGLKKLALSPPKIGRVNSWQVYFAEAGKENLSKSKVESAGISRQVKVKESAQQAGQSYRQLSPEEMEVSVRSAFTGPLPQLQQAKGEQRTTDDEHSITTTWLVSKRPREAMPTRRGCRRTRQLKSVWPTWPVTGCMPSCPARTGPSLRTSDSSSIP